MPEAAVKPLLKPGEVAAHAAFEGPLGPSTKVGFVVTEREGKLGTFAIVNGARVDGPAFAEDWHAFEVAAVMFQPGAGGDEAVVLASCITGIGPTAAVPFPCNAALTWDGKALTRDAAAEKAIASATNAADVKKAWKSH